MLSHDTLVSVMFRPENLLGHISKSLGISASIGLPLPAGQPLMAPPKTPVVCVVDQEAWVVEDGQMPGVRWRRHRWAELCPQPLPVPPQPHPLSAQRLPTPTFMRKRELNWKCPKGMALHEIRISLQYQDDGCLCKIEVFFPPRQQRPCRKAIAPGHHF